MRRKDLAGPGREPPVLLVKWYDLTRWILEKVDSIPKSQRFVFGTRLADHAIGVLETLVEASYSSTKAALLADANRKVETLRWLVRLGPRRMRRMLGGWLKQAQSKEGTASHGGRFEVSQAAV
ncbi:hypothetical protein Pla108_20740 [Botrimarina colliarenosi]|uniref:Four helix bundle protein n=1 Tax=Botrimarina colliarenosi TaxID=2528001 RepID=A0A5C6AER7_9BACT|nr:four helix bundle protein [Botrimarina colliarenosi]TWT97920.1 hypothetical protein Pla108_20740 [Botrimarina colliarenosi]